MLLQNCYRCFFSSVSKHFKKVYKSTLIENAEKEVLTIQGPIFKTGERTLTVLETFSQEKFYDKLNSLVPKKIKEGVNFKWIRNITVPHLTIYPKDEMKRFFIDFILRMYPTFQMRQISFEQFQFAIIDQKILCFFEYSEFSKYFAKNA